MIWRRLKTKDSMSRWSDFVSKSKAGSWHVRLSPRYGLYPEYIYWQFLVNHILPQLTWFSRDFYFTRKWPVWPACKKKERGKLACFTVQTLVLWERHTVLFLVNVYDGKLITSMVRQIIFFFWPTPTSILTFVSKIIKITRTLTFFT